MVVIRMLNQIKILLMLFLLYSKQYGLDTFLIHCTHAAKRLAEPDDSTMLCDSLQDPPNNLRSHTNSLLQIIIVLLHPLRPQLPLLLALLLFARR